MVTGFYFNLTLRSRLDLKVCKGHKYLRKILGYFYL